MRRAASLYSSDHVDIVIHNYKRRQSFAAGERACDDLELRLAVGPLVGVSIISSKRVPTGLRM